MRNNGKHYPKSAEYARISIQFPMIYHDCTDVLKVLVYYYAQNTAEPPTETRQKVVMDSDKGREHTNRAKFEKERIAAVQFQVSRRVGLKNAQNHKGTPFVQETMYTKSSVIDRRKKAYENNSRTMSIIQRWNICTTRHK
eukprot:390364_1